VTETVPPPFCVLQGHRKIVQHYNTNSGAHASEDSSKLAAYQSCGYCVHDLSRGGCKVLLWPCSMQFGDGCFWKPGKFNVSLLCVYSRGMTAGLYIDVARNAKFLFERLHQNLPDLCCFTGAKAQPENNWLHPAVR
jgi:hypothetical protein